MKRGGFLIEENVAMPAEWGSAAVSPSPWQSQPTSVPASSAKTTEAGVGSQTDAQAPQSDSGRKRARLKSVGDVAEELGKLYREARSKRLDVADASRLANMLSILSRILETSELEKRVAELEQRGSMH
jgi:hypothetical protein